MALKLGVYGRNTDYGCLENRVLTKIYGRKKDEVKLQEKLREKIRR
jgi:hypothetical protein